MVRALKRVVAAVVMCVAAGPVGAAEVPDRDAERKALEAARAAGDLDAMARHAEAVAAAELEDYLEASYELLRIQCRRGDEAQALATLKQMLDAGFWDYRRLLKDEELTLVTSQERVRAMVRGAWARGYIGMLERASRDAMQHPDQIMASLAIRPGEVVADVGAGSGYFTLRLASATGAEGRVIATDIRQEMLDYIAGRLAQHGVKNVELVKVEPDDPGLPAGCVDTVLMVDVIHYVKDRPAFARRLRQALAPDGRVAIVDFRYDPAAQREFAPPPEQQVPRTILDEEMRAAGFEVAAAYDFLPEQYFVIYRPTE